MNILSKIPLDWWKNSVFYQIYPRSFYDADNNGIGDLKGITQKLDYLNDGQGGGLGIDAIWVSPFFKSPMKDFGYDVSDFCDVDPIFGTMADFDEMTEACHQRGIKILVDLVLNHCSDLHPWFQESRKDRTNQKADWFVWEEKAADGGPPNNWIGVFGGSAWEYEPKRDQYYLHNFLKEQPDLNWYNTEVQQAMREIIRFWLKKGVDGFRLDTANFYAFDQKLRDNPKLPDDHPSLENRDGIDYDKYDACFSKDRPENFEFLNIIRSTIDEQESHATTIGEIGGIQNLDRLIELASSYVKGDQHLHMAYTFSLIGTRLDATSIANIIGLTETHIEDGWPCWSFGNHDSTRIKSRCKAQMDVEFFQENLMLLLLCLRGTPIIYYGEELGMTEYAIKKEELQDPFGITYWPSYPGRDGCRTPFPWGHKQHAQGFNLSHKPWLPATSTVSLDQQTDDLTSMFTLTKTMIEIRKKHPALAFGDFKEIKLTVDLYVFQRTYRSQTIIIACNFGNSSQNIKIGIKHGKQLIIPAFQRNGKWINESMELPPYGFSILIQE